jgi:mono/diheme cytochrome c family protein
MRSLRRSLGLAALAAGLVTVAWSASAADAEKGKTLFVKHGCWQCHGFLGQGGVAGPRIAPDPMPLEAMSNFVRNSNRAMPPYREAILSSADLADIHAYLGSIPSRATRSRSRCSTRRRAAGCQGLRTLGLHSVRPRASGDPERQRMDSNLWFWVPACAGTNGVRRQRRATSY